MANEYATLQELRERLNVQGQNVDSVLMATLEAASRQIDTWTGRRFYSETGARVFTAQMPDVLSFTDDLLSVTTLKTDEDGDRVYEVTWLTTDYDLEPVAGPPFFWIMTRAKGVRSFPTLRRGVEITGTWGYGSVPAPIKQASLLQAVRLFKRKDAPFGIAGSPELGELQVIGPDRDVRELIAPYRRFLVV